jgi:hypothetical protein
MSQRRDMGHPTIAGTEKGWNAASFGFSEEKEP